MEPIKFRWSGKYFLIKKGYRKAPRWGDTLVNTYGVRIAEINGPDHHNFTFYDSIHNTYTNPRQSKEDLVYSILCCVYSDYWTDLDEVADLFVDTELSVKELRDQLDEIISHTENLQRLFTDEEIEQLTENDDVLQNFVDSIKFVEVKE